MNRICLFKIIAIGCIIFLTGSINAQVINVDFEQIKGLQEVKKKPVMVFIQTDWCKYCNLMKQTLKYDEETTRLLNENFYVVYLNAEERKAIKFSGREFKFKPTGANTGVHQLALELGTIDGGISYPTLCFLNDKNEITYQYGGFLDSKSLLKTLQIISQNPN